MRRLAWVLLVLGLLASILVVPTETTGHADAVQKDAPPWDIDRVTTPNLTPDRFKAALPREFSSYVLNTEDIPGFTHARPRPFATASENLAYYDPSDATAAVRLLVNISTLKPDVAMADAIKAISDQDAQVRARYEVEQQDVSPDQAVPFTTSNETTVGIGDTYTLVWGARGGQWVFTVSAATAAEREVFVLGLVAKLRREATDRPAATSGSPTPTATPTPVALDCPATVASGDVVDITATGAGTLTVETERGDLSTPDGANRGATLVLNVDADGPSTVTWHAPEVAKRSITVIKVTDEFGGRSACFVAVIPVATPTLVPTATATPAPTVAPAPSPTRTPRPTATPDEQDDIASAEATAIACIEREDFICPVYVFKDALERHPGSSRLRLNLYLAYLALGWSREQSGDLAGARQAYQSAYDLDPSLTEASAALDRLRPYSRILLADPFDDPEGWELVQDAYSDTYFSDGALTIRLKEPGWFRWYGYADPDVRGIDYAIAVTAQATLGSSGTCILLFGIAGSAQYMFELNQVVGYWTFHRYDSITQSFEEIIPRTYVATNAYLGIPDRVEVRVYGDTFQFLVNGAIVGSASHFAYSPGEVGFGAGMDFYSTDAYFSMTFFDLAIYELTGDAI